MRPFQVWVHQCPYFPRERGLCFGQYPRQCEKHRVVSHFFAYFVDCYLGRRKNHPRRNGHPVGLRFLGACAPSSLCRYPFVKQHRDPLLFNHLLTRWQPSTVHTRFRILVLVCVMATFTNSGAESPQAFLKDPMIAPLKFYFSSTQGTATPSFASIIRPFTNHCLQFWVFGSGRVRSHSGGLYLLGPGFPRGSGLARPTIISNSLQTKPR